MEYNEIFDLLFENIRYLFFPESWFQLDLKFSKLEIFSMMIVDKRHEITMSELAEYIHAPMSTSNGVIERLVKKGYVVRDRSEADRRIVVVRLSEEGALLISGFKDMISGYLRTVLAELSEEEVKTAIEIVLKVVRGLQRRADEGGNPGDGKLKNITIE
jgi:DNA-binding MarR family transcriptional regulator